MLISSGTMPHSQSSNREGPNDTVDVPFPVACTSFSSVKNPTFAQRHLQKWWRCALPPCSHDDVSHTKDQRVKHRGTQYNALKSWWKAQLAQIFLHGLSQLTQLITAAKTSASTEGSGKKTNLHPSGIIFKELEQSLTNDYYLVTYPGIVYGLGSHDHNGAW
eukprot:CAMPEP_0194432288 /NCGR_PEP_ID=MMETSP0176-20130528/69593_1 /TAXON_ID=216777 /ORGANISM="Proboscia alata, Strain PI-D3" /LENGTH=161 /DNA_ID=CAMNT_0039248421 /DNA_START=293 /DNA_END=776 /DNA_ORIENTATION=-